MSSDSFLVIGGSGFLGRHIVNALLARGETAVAVLDIVQDDFPREIQFISGDIVNQQEVEDAIRKSEATCIIHTASPVHGHPSAIYYKVNVEGTKSVIAAAVACGVRKLVFTSSTGVVWTVKDFDGVDESVPLPKKGYDAYHETKAVAERAVLAANGRNGLRTVTLRPCGMMGPGDRQVMHRFAKMYKDGQTNIQIGDNTNVVDWVYVGNVAAAHLLAADKLDSDAVAGQVFFITNGQPIPSWNFGRAVWRELGDDDSKKIIKIPRGIAMVLASVSEVWAWITGGSTEFNRFAVRYATAVQWYDIQKARKVLGYEPEVSVDEGIKRMVKWWKRKQAGSVLTRVKAYRLLSSLV